MHTFTLAILLKKHGPCQTKKNKSKPSPKEKTNRSTYGAIQLLQDQSKIQLLFHTLTAANFQRRPPETRRHRWREKKKNKQRQRRQLCHETQWRTNPTCVGLFPSARVQRAKRGQNNRCLSKARCWFPASLRGIAVRWRKIVYICRLEDFFRLTSCQWKCACDRICTTPVSAPWSSSTHTELTMSKGTHWNVKQLILTKA